MPPKVFISYAHEDRVWCDRLQQHLGGLRHQGQLSVWADDQIMAGDEWDPEIRRELDEAAVIVLIVTPAFLGSRFCQTVELTRAMERHGEGSAKVISIIADHCHWTNLPISKLQARPQDENRNLKPLVDWPNANVPLAGIARDIDRATRQSGLSEATVPFVPAPHRTHLQQRRRTFFVGRDAEKRQLTERLAGGGRAAICAVAGMGGVGKTELALQVAGALGEAAFPDGIVTVNLMGTPDAATPLPPLAPEAAMRDVLAQLDPTAQPPTEPAALARAYTQALVGKRLLLILDNARDTAQVTPLVPPEPVALVVTSRHRIDLPEGLTLDLDTLQPDDALSLLREEIGAARALDEPTLARFANFCGYLPMALLAIAGTIKASRSADPGPAPRPPRSRPRQGPDRGARPPAPERRRAGRGRPRPLPPLRPPRRLRRRFLDRGRGSCLGDRRGNRLRRPRRAARPLATAARRGRQPGATLPPARPNLARLRLNDWATKPT